MQGIGNKEHEGVEKVIHTLPTTESWGLERQQEEVVLPEPKYLVI